MDKKTISTMKKMFDDIMHTTEDGTVEFWYARELMGCLGYTTWRRFKDAINRAIESCKSAEIEVSDHFADAVKMVEIGSKAVRDVDDILLTRYACYLIAQNGDPRKEEIAFAQSYFAVQTRKQELIEERIAYIQRTEARGKLRESEKRLSQNIYERGVDDAGFGRIRSKGDHVCQKMCVILGVIIGMLIGGMLPFLFSAMTMSSVSRAAYQMIEEVRRQFKTMPGIMKGTEKPDYKSCVAISTTAALKEMLVPGVMAVLAPLVVGILLGPSALGGLLAGALVTGVMMAIFMSNAGGAWDNAKKYIEDGNHGGKGSEAHKAAVVGDTVGDPFKDTSGPSINILIKLMTVVSLVFAPLFLSIGGLL